ncbi:MAG: hypothetical protein JWP91_881 [Fibrobacteres bacterium]|nr:hypothetical protein [Fibrobacterota bacterium]
MTDRKQDKYESDGKHSNGSGDWSRSGRRTEPETTALDRILAGFPFPASKEAVARHLAIEAFSHGEARAAELHDLVIQLDDQAFRNLDSLHRAIRERHAWEKTHDMMA